MRRLFCFSCGKLCWQLTACDYHQAAYKATSIITTPTVAILNDFSVAKLTSDKLTLLSVCFELDTSDTTTQSAKHNKKTKPTRSMNGNSGQ